MSRERVALVLVAALAAVGAIGTATGAAAKTRNAELVVSSDRYATGSRELLLLDAAGQLRRRITRHMPQGALPAWSPDGRKIAFVGAHTSASVDDFESEGLWSVNADGTGLRRLYAKRETWAPRWSPDGKRILFNVGFGGRSALWVVNADGSGTRRLSSYSLFVNDAAWSPDGRRVAASECRGGNLGCGVSVFSPGASRWQRITRPPSAAAIAEERDEVWEVRWAPDGRSVVFMRGLYGYDVPPQITVAGVTSRFERRIGYGDSPRWSPDGRWIAYVRAGARGSANGVSVVRPDGSGGHAIGDAPGIEFAPAWTADSARVVFVARARFYVASVHGGRTALLTAARAATLRGVSGDAYWAPNGRSFAADDERPGTPIPPYTRPSSDYFITIHRFGARPRPLLRPAADEHARWSPDGTRIAFVRRAGRIPRIMTVSARGGRVRALAIGTHPVWAPDGRRLAFERSGAVHVVDIARRRAVRVAEGSTPTWSRDGREVAYEHQGVIWRAMPGGGPPVRISLKLDREPPEDREDTCTPSSTSPAWAPSGDAIAYIVRCYPYGSRSALVVAAPDGTNARVTAHAGVFEPSVLVWEPSGQRLLVSDEYGFVIVDRDGAALSPRVRGQDPAWAADGSRIAFTIERIRRGVDVWSTDPAGGSWRRLTTRGRNETPAWRPR